MQPTQRQKLYCYVDETGQNDVSSAFVVVAVVSEREQEELREALVTIENASDTNHLKWHKTHPTRRLKYLELAVERNLGKGEVFFGSYPKPLPYFFPLIDVLEHALNGRQDLATPRGFLWMASTARRRPIMLSD